MKMIVTQESNTVCVMPQLNCQIAGGQDQSIWWFAGLTYVLTKTLREYEENRWYKKSSAIMNSFYRFKIFFMMQNQI